MSDQDATTLISIFAGSFSVITVILAAASVKEEDGFYALIAIMGGGLVGYLIAVMVVS